MRNTLFDYFAFTGRFFFGKGRAVRGTDVRAWNADELKS
jgi:hypothetical protein